MSTQNHQNIRLVGRSVGVGMASTLLIGLVGMSAPALATEVSGSSDSNSATATASSLEAKKSSEVKLNGVQGFLPQGETVKLSGTVKHTHHQKTRVVFKEWKHSKMKKIGTTHTNKKGRFHLRHNFGENQSLARVYVTVPGHGHVHKTLKFQYNYAGQELAGEQFSSRNLQNADFTGADLAGATFKGVNLQNADFSGADLTGVRFKKSKLNSSNFSNSNLEDARFVQSKARGADFEGAHLKNADLHNGNFHESFFVGADLSQSNLTDAQLTVVDLSEADLTGANLSGAQLDQSNVKQALLTNANLTGADLGGVDFTGADLTGADLSDAVFLQTTMPDGTIKNPI